MNQSLCATLNSAFVETWTRLPFGELFPEAGWKTSLNLDQTRRKSGLVKKPGPGLKKNLFDFEKPLT
jgi:hypothetical protein